MTFKSFLAETAKSILFVAIATGMLLAISGCEEKNKPKFYQVVYRTNTDGTTTSWQVHEGVRLVGAFACWDGIGGGEICASGQITIINIKLPEPEVHREKKE